MAIRKPLWVPRSALVEWLEARTMPAPLITHLALLNDTGVSTNDRITTDPSLTGTVSNGGGHVDGLVIEVDTNNDGSADGVTVTDTGGGFTYLPTGLSPGSLTVKARAKDYDAAQQTYVYSSWVSLTFTLEALDPAPVVTSFGLLDDTGPDDGITYNPAVTGSVTDESGAANLPVQIDTNGDGYSDISLTSDAQNVFTWSPGALSPGTYTYAARGGEYDPIQAAWVYGEWHTTQFTLAPPNAPPSVTSLSLVNDTGSSSMDHVTTDPRLKATVTNDGSVAGLVVEFDQDGDGIADGSASTDTAGNVVYFPSNLAPGAVTIRARGREFDPVLGADQVGSWTSVSFTLVLNTGPVITSLVLSNDTGVSNSDAITTDPTVRGTATNSDGKAGLTILIDTNGDGAPDGSTTTDSNGNFSYVPQGLVAGPQVIRARASAFSAGSGTMMYSDWQVLSFTLLSHQTAAPTLSSIGLVNDNGTYPTDKVTTDPRLFANVTTSETTVNSLAVEFDTNGDNVPDASVSADPDGNVIYNPLWARPGTVTVRARAKGYDTAQSAFLTGGWTSFTFTLLSNSQATPVVSGLALVNDTGSSATDLVTADPTFGGKVTQNGTASAGLVVEVDTNGDGQPDGTTTTDTSGSFAFIPAGLAAGSVTVKARAKAYDYGLSAYVVGSWSTLSFTLTTASAPTITSLSLANDNGVSSNDGITSDPAICGIASAGASGTAGLAIELDTNGDGKADAEVTADGQGGFQFRPSQRPADGSVTVQARAKTLDATTHAWTVGAWTSLTYTLVAPAPPTVTGLSLVNDDGVSSTDLTTSDPRIKGVVLADGSTANAVVQVDSLGNGTPTGTVQTDGEGNFVYDPRDAKVGTVSLSVRAGVYDPDTKAYSYSAWVPFSFTLTSATGTSPTITNFQLLKPGSGGGTPPGTGGMITVGGIPGGGGTPSSADPTVTGTVTSAGNVNHVTVEIDTNSDGTPDGSTTTDAKGNFTYHPTLTTSGTVTIKARAKVWNYSTSTYNYGAWSSLSFSYTASTPTNNPGAVASTPGGGSLVKATADSYRSAVAKSTSTYNTNVAASGSTANGAAALGAGSYTPLNSLGNSSSSTTSSSPYLNPTFAAGTLTTSPQNRSYSNTVTTTDSPTTASGSVARTETNVISYALVTSGSPTSGSYTLDVKVDVSFSTTEKGSYTLTNGYETDYESYVMNVTGTYHLVIHQTGTYSYSAGSGYSFSGTISITESGSYTSDFIDTDNYTLSGTGSGSVTTDMTGSMSFAYTEDGSFSSSGGHYSESDTYSISGSNNFAYSQTDSGSFNYSTNMGGSSYHASGSFNDHGSGTFGYSYTDQGSYTASDTTYRFAGAYTYDENGGQSSSTSEQASVSWTSSGDSGSGSGSQSDSYNSGYTYGESGTYVVTDTSYRINGSAQITEHDDESVTDQGTESYTTTTNGTTYSGSDSYNATGTYSEDYSASVAQTSLNGLTTVQGSVSDSVSGSVTESMSDSGSYVVVSAPSGNHGTYSDSDDASGQFSASITMSFTSVNGAISINGSFSSDDSGSDDFSNSVSGNYASSSSSSSNSGSFTYDVSGTDAVSSHYDVSFVETPASLSVSGSYSTTDAGSAHVDYASSGTYSSSFSSSSYPYGFTVTTGTSNGSYNVSETEDEVMSNSDSGTYAFDNTSFSLTDNVDNSDSLSVTYSSSGTVQTTTTTYDPSAGTTQSSCTSTGSVTGTEQMTSHATGSASTNNGIYTSQSLTARTDIQSSSGSGSSSGTFSSNLTSNGTTTTTSGEFSSSDSGSSSSNDSGTATLYIGVGSYTSGGTYDHSETSDVHSSFQETGSISATSSWSSSSDTCEMSDTQKDHQTYSDSGTYSSSLTGYTNDGKASASTVHDDTYAESHVGSYSSTSSSEFEPGTVTYSGTYNTANNSATTFTSSGSGSYHKDSGSSTSHGTYARAANGNASYVDHFEDGVTFSYSASVVNGGTTTTSNSNDASSTTTDENGSLTYHSTDSGSYSTSNDEASSSGNSAFGSDQTDTWSSSTSDTYSSTTTTSTSSSYPGLPGVGGGGSNSSETTDTDSGSSSGSSNGHSTLSSSDQGDYTTFSSPTSYSRITTGQSTNNETRSGAASGTATETVSHDSTYSNNNTNGGGKGETSWTRTGTTSSSSSGSFSYQDATTYRTGDAAAYTDGTWSRSDGGSASVDYKGHYERTGTNTYGSSGSDYTSSSDSSTTFEASLTQSNASTSAYDGSGTFGSNSSGSYETGQYTKSSTQTGSYTYDDKSSSSASNSYSDSTSSQTNSSDNSASTTLAGDSSSDSTDTVTYTLGTAGSTNSGSYERSHGSESTYGATSSGSSSQTWSDSDGSGSSDNKSSHTEHSSGSHSDSASGTFSGGASTGDNSSDDSASKDYTTESSGSSSFSSSEGSGDSSSTSHSNGTYTGTWSSSAHFAPGSSSGSFQGDEDSVKHSDSSGQGTYSGPGYASGWSSSSSYDDESVFHGEGSLDNNNPSGTWSITSSGSVTFAYSGWATVGGVTTGFSFGPITIPHYNVTSGTITAGGMQQGASWMDNLQTVLDVVSLGMALIPPLEPFTVIVDELNAGISALRGNYEDAAIRAAFGAIPVLGKAGHAALAASDGSKITQELVNIGAKFEPLGQAGRVAFGGFSIMMGMGDIREGFNRVMEGDWWGLVQIARGGLASYHGARDIAHAANDIGLVNLCGSPLGAAFGIGNCFVAGTEVVLADDSRTVLLAALPARSYPHEPDAEAGTMELLRVPLGITCVVVGLGLAGMQAFRYYEERRRRRLSLSVDLAIAHRYGPDDPDEPVEIVDFVDDLAALLAQQARRTRVSPC